MLCWCWDVPQGTTGEFLLALIGLNWFQLEKKNTLTIPSHAAHKQHIRKVRWRFDSNILYVLLYLQCAGIFSPRVIQMT